MQKRIKSMQLDNMAVKNFVAVSSSRGVEYAVDAMRRAKANFLLIEYGGELKGVIPSANLLGYPLSRLLLDCPMRKALLVPVGVSVNDALRRLAGEKAAYLVVIGADGKPLGVIDQQTLISFLYEKLLELDIERQDHIAELEKTKQTLQKAYDKIKQREAEREITREEFRLHSEFLKNMTEGILVARVSNAAIIYTNRRFEEMFGYDPGELIGKNVSLLNAPTGKSEIQNELRKYGFWNGELLNIKKDGTPFWCRTNISTLETTRRGTVWVEAYEDITKRKNAEKKLREKEITYRILVENIPHTMFLKDNDSVYVSCNENYARCLKIKPDEIAGRTDYDFFPKELADKHRAEDAKIIKSGKSDEAEGKYIQNGINTWLHTIKTPIKDEGGKAIGMLGISWDITERKKMEKMKDNLIRNISHKLKTPIAKAKMALEIYKESIERNDAEQTRKFGNMLYNNLGKIARDVDNLLEMYKLDMEKEKEKEKEKVSIERVIRELLKDEKDRIDNKRLKLEIDIPEEADKAAIIWQDMRFLIHNIIDNAIKFTESGSISIKSRLKDKWIEIKLKDTGCGIAAGDIDRVFEKFYQRHVAVGGVGLGLSICKEIVKIHDGKIEVESKGIEKGTTVTVRLPRG